MINVVLFSFHPFFLSACRLQGKADGLYLFLFPEVVVFTTNTIITLRRSGVELVTGRTCSWMSFPVYSRRPVLLFFLDIISARQTKNDTSLRRFYMVYVFLTFLLGQLTFLFFAATRVPHMTANEHQKNYLGSGGRMFMGALEYPDCKPGGSIRILPLLDFAPIVYAYGG